LSKWEKVRLGELCNTNIDTLSSKEDCLIDYIDISSIDNEKKEITSYKVYEAREAPSRAKLLIKKNDVLVSTVRPNLNAVAMITCETTNKMVASTGFCILRSNGSLDNKYLFYFTRSKSFITKLMRAAKGASYPAVSNTDVLNISIPFPPLDIQEKIANELETVSRLLSLQKRKIEELDRLIKSVFYNMFGDLVTNEKGWDKKYITEICIINPRKTELGQLDDDTLVSFIPMSSVSENGEIDTSQTKKYKEVKVGFSYFRDNDVLFAKITPCMENGKGAVARNLCNSIGFGSTEFHVLRPIENLTDSEWLFRLTTLPIFRINAEKNMTGSAGQKRVPVSFFDKFSVGLPPIELQKKYASIVSKIEAQKSLVKKTIAETQRLFDSLMSKYFDD